MCLVVNCKHTTRSTKPFCNKNCERHLYCQNCNENCELQHTGYQQMWLKIFWGSVVYLCVSGNFMRSLLYISTLLFLSCNNQTKRPDLKTHLDTTKQVVSASKQDKSKYYITKDILIITETRDTLKYSKDEFNHIVDNHPELTNDFAHDPDQTYYCNADKEEFDSEVGQDTYYILYAYFLKQKNGIDKYDERRKKIIGIYSNINSLFRYFEYGGTYFGHQQSRILGYAEYSIYLYRQNEKYISKKFDIGKQKELYIKSLRQLIEDESKIDFNTLGQEKLKRTQELNKIVDDIDKAITDNYYLRRAQEFHYEHYEYY